jgi:hypothetical protein
VLKLSDCAFGDFISKPLLEKFEEIVNLKHFEKYIKMKPEKFK